MEISFDPAKRDLTLQERGLDFADAATVFEGPVYETEDQRFAYPERRYSTIGLLDDRMVVVIWTVAERGRRVISMRKANDREQTRYRSRLA
ncbi:BrnT family toxin [Sphingomonas echinoides]|uniref:BrnT family toxin n=1 Tax=Sphingomonas echinoides TaxID=59803 RepID=A0ABU4PP71_9SPHN|nr:BrnT family toxin [Sphingomonas echinoides]MDX5985948.1 BrnT family toxin [Sphingomonas echinoides]